MIDRISQVKPLDQISGQALEAEKSENWVQAAIYWRRISRLPEANLCEELAAHLAITGRETFHVK